MALALRSPQRIRMIISRTPLRVSFAGGGTDLPAFYEEEPGAVVSTAIDKYIYITTNKKFDSSIRASYSLTEIVETAAELKHGLIRECLKMAGIGRGIEITSISDIPSSGTGLGSSSTYTVGLLNALYAYVGRHAAPGRLAKEACEIEIDLLGNPIGKQDQYAAAFGGLRYIQFNPDGTVFSDPIVCDPSTKRKMEDRLLMLYTGTTRSANAILSQQSANTRSEAGKRNILRKMKAQADACRSALEQNCLDEFGELLHEGWLLKKDLASGISNPTIDDWYDRAKKNGAIGGKILGAGGGGFLLLYAHPEHHDLLQEALPELKRTKFLLEPQGSKIIFVEEPPHL
jgi:D-glycero-alpha-D-manno-heptose-7-phosphate kinase